MLPVRDETVDAANWLQLRYFPVSRRRHPHCIGKLFQYNSSSRGRTPHPHASRRSKVRTARHCKHHDENRSSGCPYRDLPRRRTARLLSLPVPANVRANLLKSRRSVAFGKVGFGVTSRHDP